MIETNKALFLKGQYNHKLLTINSLIENLIIKKLFE
jgi:hypothetical protein